MPARETLVIGLAALGFEKDLLLAFEVLILGVDAATSAATVFRAGRSRRVAYQLRFLLAFAKLRCLLLLRRVVPRWQEPFLMAIDAALAAPSSRLAALSLARLIVTVFFVATAHQISHCVIPSMHRFTENDIFCNFERIVFFFACACRTPVLFGDAMSALDEAAPARCLLRRAAYVGDHTSVAPAA